MKYLIFSVLLTSVLFSSDVDIYKLNYNGKTQTCSLTKNSKKIDLYDKRFKKKSPAYSYTCASVQKERYKSCKIIQQKNVTAVALTYGAYERTNFILAFQGTQKRIDANMEAQCTKTKILLDEPEDKSKK